MNCVVTGGLGFIGSHLVEFLLSQHDRVTIVDSGARPADWCVPRECRVLHEDVNTWARRYANYSIRYDEVYHLASVVGPVSLLREPGQIAFSLVNDLTPLTEYCQITGTRLLYASTSEVYGGAVVSHEDDVCQIRQSVASPRLEYAVSKLTDEIVIRNTPELHAVIVRPFNVVGPRQGLDGGFVLPRFLSQALAGRPLTVYGDGSCVRSLTHVHDIVRGMVLALRHGQNKRVYNLGNPLNRITMQLLAELVIDMTGSTGGIRHVDPRELWGPLFQEAGDKVPDIARAQAELKWMPEHDLVTIVTDTLAWMKQSAKGAHA